MMRPHLSFRQKYQLLLWKDMKLQFASVAELVAIFILAALMPVLITIGRKVSKSLFRYEVEVEKAPGPKILDTCVFRDLYYSPYNGLVEKLVFELSNSSECFGYEGFDTTRELHLKMIENKEAAGIAFPHEWATIQTYPDYLNFTLYMPLNLKKRHSGYFESGFLMIQERLSRLFIQFKSSRGRHRKNIAKVRMNHFPYPRYVPNYYANSAIAVTYTILISFFLPCITIVKYIVAEREYQQKAVLNTMGFRNSIHWLAWYTKSMILLILCVLLILTIFAIGSIYEFSNHVCLFIVLLAYCHSLVLFAFFVSAFFSRSYWAAVLALLLYVATALPYVIVGDRHSSLASQTAACFGLNSALFYILQSVAKMEKQSVGIQWYTMAKTASRGHKLSIVAHMTIMLVTSCVELLVCLYIEEVRHGGFGVPQPWYYPFQRRYWFSRRFGLKKDPLLPISKPSARSGYFATSDDRYRSLTTEKVPIGKIPIVEVRNLNKQFKNRVVVKDLTFNMYENEITALLGHNACGKTTTILMLCGMLSPTSGTAVINGYDIVKERKFAKASLGICAQHSVLFKGLTVYDHIYFFSRLKGYATHDARMETEMYIRKLNLAAFSRVDALKLSSGNQRRLSLACALCGGSKVIFCDEPSSGLDPRGRHDLWRLLQKEKQGRAVLMTTHLMEEAEILGDRIAIMSNGELRSFGTLGFLKQIHNASFTLYVEMGLNCKLDKLTDLVTHVASASEPVIRGPDVTFKLPRNMIGKFSVLFHLLEINKKILDVVSFDFSDASLEEIILSLDPEHEPRPRGGADEDKNSFGTQTDLVDRAAARAERRRARELARQAASSTSSQAKPEPEPKEPPKSNLIRKPSEQSRPKPELTFRGRASVMGLCQAMMMKKAYYTRYHFGLFLLILFIPLIFFFIVLATSEYERGNKLIVEPTVMELSLNYYSYDDMIILLEVDDRFFKKEGQGYVEAVKKPAQVEKIKSIFAHLFKAPPLVRRDIRRKYVCGASFNDSSTITAWFNSNAFEHSAPIALNLVYEAIGKAATGSAFNIFVHRGHLDESHMAKSTLTKHRSKRQDNVDYEDYEDYEFREEDNPSINDFNKTLKNPSYNSITPSDVQIIPHMSVSESRSVFYNERESMYLIFAAIIIIIAYLALALSSFAIFVTEERVQQMKMQQDLQSLSPGCFWFTHFIWDYFICAFYMMALTLAIYQDTIWYQSLIIFLLIGFACLPFIYLCSLLFKKPATAFVMNFTIQLVTGGILFCFLFFVSSVSNSYILGIPVIFPMYVGAFGLFKCLSWGKVCEREIIPVIDNLKCNFGDPNVFCACPEIYKWNEFYLLMIHGIIWSIILWISCFGRDIAHLCSKSQSNRNWQADDKGRRVFDEEIRVGGISKYDQDDYPVIVDQVVKNYCSTKAVKFVSFAMNPGECFGLLGANGAGKTSIIRMIVGETRLSGGNIYVQGHSLRGYTTSVLAKENIGYCPQYDTLHGFLTGRQTLKIHWLLRGIPKKDIPRLSKQLAIDFGFEKHLDQKVRTYSGGTKRKLSVALAVYGGSIICLDEPNRGVDPVSRHYICQKLEAACYNGKTVLLATHSMEEVNAICPRIGVLVSGKMESIGSVQQVRSEICDTIVLKLKIKANPIQLKKARKKMEADIAKLYPAAVLQESIDCWLIYHINKRYKTWSNLFHNMEQKRIEGQLDDYSISLASLEEILRKLNNEKLNNVVESDSDDSNDEACGVNQGRIQRPDKSIEQQIIIIDNKREREQLLKKQKEIKKRQKKPRRPATSSESSDSDSELPSNSNKPIPNR